MITDHITVSSNELDNLWRISPWPTLVATQSFGSGQDQVCPACQSWQNICDPPPNPASKHSKSSPFPAFGSHTTGLKGPWQGPWQGPLPGSDPGWAAHFCAARGKSCELLQSESPQTYIRRRPARLLCPFFVPTIIHLTVGIKVTKMALVPVTVPDTMFNVHTWIQSLAEQQLTFIRHLLYIRLSCKVLCV